MPDPAFYARMVRLSSIVTILPAAMAGGWVLGYFLIDRMLKTFPWGSIAATLFGAVAGLYEIYRLLTRDRHD
jgi:F0F1-type ATP synthase assembly protein I